MAGPRVSVTIDPWRRQTQDEYLEAARCVGFRHIVDGIRDILLRTSAHQKYYHLT